MTWRGARAFDFLRTTCMATELLDFQLAVGIRKVKTDATTTVLFWVEFLDRVEGFAARLGEADIMWSSRRV